jgi:copper chaperone
MSITLNVTGMTCGHCEKAVTQAVRRVDPQAQVQINRAHNQVVVDSQQPQTAIAQAIRDEGYQVEAGHQTVS